MTFGTVVIVVNESRPHAVELARQAAEWLDGHGYTVRLPKHDAQATGLEDLGTDPDALGTVLELALALGGDGTMLRAVHLAASHGAPVLGVNLGRLAYLSAIEPDRLCDALEQFAAGEYGVEERTMLSLAVEGPGAGFRRLGLNEAVLEKNAPGHTVYLAVSVSGRPFISYVADGLIMATPTGSTAYAFSAGGPIVSPRHQALIMTPVSPHTPFSRSVVLHPEEPVTVEVLDHRGAVLTVDGAEVARLGQGDIVSATVAPVPARFVTFGERDFYGVLKAKFGLADR